MRIFPLMAIAALLGAPPTWAQEPDDEVARLSEQVAAKRDELRQAEARLHEALRKKIAGTDRLPPLPTADRSPFDLDEARPSRTLAPPSRSLPIPSSQRTRDAADPSLTRASSAREDRLAELERRLDRLAEEMKGVRREIEELKRERR
jgi:hypothetical protein